MARDWIKQRRAWIVYLRWRRRLDEERRAEERLCPDGMCHGIIPFGAVQESLDREARRLREALADPSPAWRIGVEPWGVCIGVICPYCRQEHQHWIAADEWDPDARYEAECFRGRYLMRLL
jgi:hypothetical protein